MPELDRIQRWMQAVVTHPDGPLAGVASLEAKQEIDVSAENVERVVQRSRALTSLERLEIYAGAYHARLIECLREEYPVLARVLGEEVFDAFAFDYLQRYPSRTYTLNVLGAHFASFLAETRPDDDPADAAWVDLMIDLAALEWAIGEVFDGPGVEGQSLLDEEHLRAIPPARWPEARLLPVPCLRLLAFRHPLKDYYTAMREGEESAPPAPEPAFLALNRCAFVVRLHELSRPQYILLGALIEGKSLNSALGLLGEEDELDATDLRSWFLEWTLAGFFRAVDVDSPAD